MKQGPGILAPLERYGWAGVGLALAALATWLAASPVLAPVRLSVSDALVRWAVRFPPPLAETAPDIGLVVIDAQSLRSRFSWPWPRTLYADLIRALDAAGAAAIVFDLDFSSATQPEHDAALAKAIAVSGRVVLATSRSFQEVPGFGEMEVLHAPAEGLARHAAVGHVVLPVDSDGRVRAFSPNLLLTGRDTPSLAAATLGAVSDGPVDPASLAGPSRPVDFRMAGIPAPIVPIAHVLDGSFDTTALRGRAVFVGATASVFQDLWNTPLGAAQPGVWIQALAYRTLAASREGRATLHREGWQVSFAAVALLSIALTGALRRLDHGRRVAALLAVAAAAPIGCAAVLARTGALLDPLPFWLLAAGSYATSLEALRGRFGRRIQEHESAIARIAELGERALVPGTDSGLGQGLALLSQALGADAVVLARADRAGRLTGETVARPPGFRPSGGTLAAARRAFDARSLETVGAERTEIHLPLACAHGPLGVLSVLRASGLDHAQLQMATTVAAQLTLALDNYRLVEDLRATLADSVEAVASAIEARDGYTESHCRRLAFFSVLVAERLGLDEQEIEAIRLGALLHDVGKIGIRDAILLKPGRFTTDERVAMERHAEIGHRIVQPITGLARTTIDCVRHHHERWDGGGYPDRLAGDEIPLGARIVAVVDVWDALSTARPYKPALGPDEVLRILQKGRGTQFDPRIVDAFLRVLEEEGGELVATGGAS